MVQSVKLPPTGILDMTQKQFDGEVPVMELRGMWSTPSLPSLPGPLWPCMIAHNRVLSMG